MASGSKPRPRASGFPLVGLALGLAFTSTLLKPRVMQDGCDSPAHLLLSETWLKAPHQTGSPGLRLALARSLAARGFALEQYSRSLGPLCTHWNGTYQYNQYPPGLPVALSIAPFELRGLWYGMIVFFVFFLAGWRCRIPGRVSRACGASRAFEDDGFFLPLLAASPLVLPVLFPFLVSIHGMAVCFGLLALILIIIICTGEREPSGRSVGALVGVCLLTRYDTLIPLGALALILALCGMSRRFWAEAILMAILVGGLPLLAYQKLALGTPWRPLTPSYDLAWVSGAGQLLDHAMAQLGWFNLRFAALWLLGALLFKPLTPRERRLKAGWMVASVAGFLFVCAKQVQSSYYLWPWAAMGFGFFLVGVSRTRLSRRSRALYASIILAWALVNTVAGARVQAEQARQYRQLAKGIAETWPRRSPSWIVAGSYSALVDAMRVHLGLGVDPIVTDGGRTPPEVARELDAALSARRVPVYRFNPADGTLVLRAR